MSEDRTHDISTWSTIETAIRDALSDVFPKDILDGVCEELEKRLMPDLRQSAFVQLPAFDLAFADSAQQIIDTLKRYYNHLIFTLIAQLVAMAAQLQMAGRYPVLLQLGPTFEVIDGGRRNPESD